MAQQAQDRSQNPENSSSQTAGAKEQNAERITRQVGAADVDIEAIGTDGKGTGGVGADLGGYGPVPGSDSAG